MSVAAGAGSVPRPRVLVPSFPRAPAVLRRWAVGGVGEVPCWGILQHVCECPQGACASSCASLLPPLLQPCLMDLCRAFTSKVSGGGGRTHNAFSLLALQDYLFLLPPFPAETLG